jgi:hypothetical protein
MANTFTLINSATAGSGGVGSISFTSIPQTYTDLFIYVSARSNRVAENDDILLQLNSTSTTGLLVYGAGSGGVGGDTSPRFVINASTSLANTFGSANIYITNYTSTSINKSYSADSAFEDNKNYAILFASAGIYSSNTAVTSITLAPSNGTLLFQYSTAYLYGISKT